MSFPNFPNPARRAKLLHAHQLRQQGLTLRQIAQRMDCAHSTVAGYLTDFELFRTDLIQELAADQIVSHVIQLADLADEHHDRRLAAVRELRLLLGRRPQDPIRRIPARRRAHPGRRLRRPLRQPPPHAQPQAHAHPPGNGRTRTETPNSPLRPNSTPTYR